MSAHRIAICMAVAVALAGCAMGPTPPGETGGSGDTRERRVAAASADATRLQSQLLALADTALARITAETAPGIQDKDPAVRRFSLTTRLSLGSALIGIVTGPDPVDALLDMLTHTTLVADGMRNEARDKPAASPEARLLEALALNEADAWKLAARWVDAPTRSALRALILSWPGERKSASGVAYVRISDLPRAGSVSAESADGAVSALRAAVRQAEQARLLGERAVFLAQHMPYEVRWQAELFTLNTLTTDEARRVLESVDALKATADSAVREVARMPEQLSRERSEALQDLFARFERERSAALRDMFARIELERRATLEQMASIVQAERTAILSGAGEAITVQRKAIFQELTDVAGRAEEQGRAWATAALVAVSVLMIVLLLSLFGLLLLYRRLLQRMERHPPR